MIEKGILDGDRHPRPWLGGIPPVNPVARKADNFRSFGVSRLEDEASQRGDGARDSMKGLAQIGTVPSQSWRGIAMELVAVNSSSWVF